MMKRLFECTEPLASEVTELPGVCLVKPAGVRSLACVYVNEYQVWVEAQVWNSQASPASDQAEETERVTVVVSGCITASAVAYDWSEGHEPHSEDQPKFIIVREPPGYLPPKRESRPLC